MHTVVHVFVVVDTSSSILAMSKTDLQCVVSHPA